MLQAGDRLTTRQHGTVQVGALLGSGGQGDVYQVTTDVGDRALKWYYPSAATGEQLQIIREAVDKNISDPRLLWPEALVESGGEFGYLMAIRPERFIPLSRIINGRVAVTTRVLLRAAVRLVGAFRTIQSHGLAYRDIKDPNVFVDPATGDVLVCDNDNAIPDGFPSSIQGTTDFCAPELLTKGLHPTRLSDLHSLAVLLFMMLNRGHPLDGAAERQIRNLDENARIWLYGTNPVFIFDPTNDTNRPESPTHDHVVRYWSIWPEQLRVLWTKAFTRGLQEPGQRPSYRQWEEALSSAHDALLQCTHCGSFVFLDPRVHTISTGIPCWRCERVSVPPFYARVGDHLIALAAGAEIFPHHLSREYISEAFEDCRFVVQSHPTQPGIVGLTNTSGANAAILSSTGERSNLEVGKTVQLAEGLQIETGANTVHIRSCK